MNRAILTVSSIFIAIGGCSVSTVDVGRNAKQPESLDVTNSDPDPDGQVPAQTRSEGDKVPTEEQPEGSELNQPIEGEPAGTANTVVSSAAPVQNAVWGSCFAEGAEHPEALEPLCSNPPAHLVQRYSKTINELCTVKRNLSWFCKTGGTLARPMGRYRILEQTKTNDPGRDFYNFAMNAVTYPKASISYLTLLKLAYTDRATYDLKYLTPSDVGISPDGVGIINANGGEEIGYHFTTTLSPSRFDGRIFIWKPAPNITYLFNYAEKNLQSLEKRAGLSIVRGLTDGREHVVNIDERKMPDMGLHAQFRQKMQNLDKTDLETRLKNMEIAK